MEKKYYLPISSKCLAHYFGNACVMPSRYFSNKPADIQNNFDEYLLLTTNLGTNETDCCLELVLTKNEINELIDIKNGFYLYQKPLPISRIKSHLPAIFSVSENTTTSECMPKTLGFENGFN